MAHNHDHTHDDDVDMLEDGVTPVAAAEAHKTGFRQTWRTYGPAIVSLVLLLAGIALDAWGGQLVQRVRSAGLVHSGILARGLAGAAPGLEQHYAP